MNLKNYLPVHVLVVIGAMCLTGITPAGIASIITVVGFFWLFGSKR